MGKSTTSLFAAGLLALASSCSPTANRGAAHAALRIAELSCVFASEYSDVESVLEACRIERALAPVVRELILQRQAARRAGVPWQSTNLEVDAK